MRFWNIRSKSTLKLELFLFGQKLFVENNPKYHALCIVYHTICIRNKISILNGKNVGKNIKLNWFSNIWQTQTFKSIEWLKQSIKQTLLDQFLQDWNSSVHNSPKASNYRIFKTEFKGLGAIRAKIGPTSDVDKIFSKMYSQYVLFRNKYS